jgi:hypothetical protein
MAVAITVTINTPSPALESRVSEVRFVEQALQAAIQEIGRGSGNITSGTCGGKGAWTWVPSGIRP